MAVTMTMIKEAFEKDPSSVLKAAGMALQDGRDEDAENLYRLGTVEEVTDRFLTVAEYIEIANPETKIRTSKKGTELVEVTYHNGEAREYDKALLGRTSSFFRASEL